MRIATLEDDPAHASVIEKALIESGHTCYSFSDGKVLLRDLHRGSFDMFVLDWHVPNVEGPDIVRWVRRHVPERVPVLFVTSRNDERDIVEGLECGADDYMIKPIRPEELKARVRALLRRAYPELEGTPPSMFGPYAFDLQRREVRLAGELIALKPKEYELALFLFRNTGRLLGHEHLLAELWGTGDIDSRTVSTHMSQLRRKLELRPQNGFRLVPVYGLGYRFEAVPTVDAGADASAQEDGQ